MVDLEKKIITQAGSHSVSEKSVRLYHMIERPLEYQVGDQGP